MKWHDCKTDPPKKHGEYVLWGIDINLTSEYKDFLKIAYFVNDEWRDRHGKVYGKSNELKWRVPYKWAEVNLDKED